MKKVMNMDEKGIFPTSIDEKKVIILPITESTNTLVKEMAAAGEPEGYVVIAKEQTGGRGRRGRSFFSPAGTGVYMSILLRPDQYTAKQAAGITTMAAVAMCEAIEEIFGEPAMIKWVNDIFVRGRKVCGILTEASLNMKNGLVDYAVLGAGVNVYAPKGGFPEDIANKAGAICPGAFLEEQMSEGKRKLAVTFLKYFWTYYKCSDLSLYTKEYRRRSLAIGQKVIVISGQDTRAAVAYDVDDECCLLVRYENGETERLSSGEISIKLE